MALPEKTSYIQFNRDISPYVDQKTQIVREETVWNRLDSCIKGDAVTVVTLQTGPTAEGHKYHHAFAVKLENGDICLIGVPSNMSVNHGVAGSKEGLQFKDNPDRMITDKIDPEFVAVVHRDGTLEGDLPPQYKNLDSVLTAFGYFYDKGVLGSFRLAKSLDTSHAQLGSSEPKEPQK